MKSVYSYNIHIQSKTMGKHSRKKHEETKGEGKIFYLFPKCLSHSKKKNNKAIKQI